MKKTALTAGIVGIAVNLLLFVTKLYIGVTLSSLSVYCDAMNNLGDTLACGVAVLGFSLTMQLNETKSARAQSLCTFVISLFIAVTGVYFVYNGTERLFYPIPVAYAPSYATCIAVTIGVKNILGFLFLRWNKTVCSPVLQALALDSFLDCFITAFVLMSLLLVERVNFAVDGVFAILCGTIISVSAVKNIISETKFLIHN